MSIHAFLDASVAAFVVLSKLLDEGSENIRAVGPDVDQLSVQPVGNPGPFPDASFPYEVKVGLVTHDTQVLPRQSSNFDSPAPYCTDLANPYSHVVEVQVLDDYAKKWAGIPKTVLPMHVPKRWQRSRVFGRHFGQSDA